MVINIKGTQLEVTPAIREYVERQLSGVYRLLAHRDAQEPLIAEVEIERTTQHHRKGDVYRAEINLDVPKKLLRAEARAEDIRVAIHQAAEELEQEVKKYKSVGETIVRKARRASRKNG